MQFTPEGLAMLSAGAGMLDPRGTYGQFGAGLNQGVQQGIRSFIPLQRNQLAQEEEKRRRQLSQFNQDQVAQKQADEAAYRQRVAQFQPTGDPRQGYANLALDAPTPALAQDTRAHMNALYPQKPQAPWWVGPEGQIHPAKTAERMAGATNVTQTIGGSLTKGQEAVDKDFAKKYTEYSASGGYADATKQINQLNDVIDMLDNENLTGAIIGNLPDRFRTIFTPAAVDAQERVEEVIQRNLREVLGAQFTEKEGERLIARAYNPKLDEKTNQRRLKNLVWQMKEAAKSKASSMEYFEKHGTLKGWKGKLPTFDDFDPDRESSRMGEVKRMKEKYNLEIE